MDRGREIGLVANANTCTPKAGNTPNKRLRSIAFFAFQSLRSLTAFVGKFSEQHDTFDEYLEIFTFASAPDISISVKLLCE